MRVVAVQAWSADPPLLIAVGVTPLISLDNFGERYPAHRPEASYRITRPAFAFIGIRDIEIIRAEGLALGPAHREAALNTAHATIPDTVAAARIRHAV